jgi:transposase
MPTSPRPYPAEFRRRIVELARAGRSPKELAAEFGPSENSIRNWIQQADRDEGLRADGLTTAEAEEVRRLRRELKQVKLEREILAKAAAWFARETDSIPSERSSS